MAVGEVFAFPNDPLALAGGGIVTRPTFALIGEAGPEAIIPLGRGGGVGSTIVVNVNVLRAAWSANTSWTPGFTGQ